MTTILHDRAIVNHISAGRIFKKNDLPDPLLGKASPIQPCSLDLRIGKIYLPEVSQNEPGGADQPITTTCALKPGQTAVVVTQEEFKLASNIGGIGFPPTRISANGILMTNPGHIDPGYEGTLSLTIINMGKDNFTLICGENIISCILFELATAPDEPFRGQGGGHGSVHRLSADFLDVRQRAELVAIDIAERYSLKLGLGGIASLALAVVLGYLPMLSVANDVRIDVKALREGQIPAIEKRLDKTEHDGELDKLKDRLLKLEAANQKEGSIVPLLVECRTQSEAKYAPPNVKALQKQPQAKSECK